MNQDDTVHIQYSEVRISVFNIIGFLGFLCAVIYIFANNCNDSPIFTQFSLIAKDFWSFYLLIFTVNTVIFIELWYYEEDHLFHTHMVNKNKGLRVWDFLLRCAITLLLVSWLIPNLLKLNLHLFAQDSLSSYLYHIIVISFLLLIWSLPVNRNREGVWTLYNGETYQINGQAWKFLFPYIVLIAYSIILRAGLYFIENPQSLVIILSHLPFLSIDVNLQESNVKLWINYAGGSLSFSFLILLAILRINEWRRVFYIGRVV